MSVLRRRNKESRKTSISHPTRGVVMYGIYHGLVSALLSSWWGDKNVIMLVAAKLNTMAYIYVSLLWSLLYRGSIITKASTLEVAAAVVYY